MDTYRKSETVTLHYNTREKKELVCVVLGGLVIRSLNAVMLDSLKKTHLCLTPICLTFRSTEIETLIL